LQVERRLSERVALGIHRGVDGGEHIVKLRLADAPIANGDEAHLVHPRQGHRHQG
jgi:hypothetical protein